MGSPLPHEQTATLVQLRLHWAWWSIGFAVAWAAFLVVALAATTWLTCTSQGVTVLATAAGALQAFAFLALPIPLPIVAFARLSSYLERTRGMTLVESRNMGVLAAAIYLALSPALALAYLSLLVSGMFCATSLAPLGI